MGFWGFYSGAKKSFSSDGKPTFTLGNGQQVPRADGAGGMGVPDDKGGVLYPDGTYINTNGDGGTNVFNPDGTRDEGSSRPGTSGQGNSGSSRRSDNDNSNNDDDNSSDNNDDSNDSDDDSKDSDDDSSGGSEDTSDSSDESTESDTDTEGAEESQTGLDTGSYGGYTSEGKQAVDNAASVGNSTTEEVVLGDCGDGKGGQVMDQQQQQDNCTPGGLVVGGGDDDEDDSSGKAPIWQAPSTSTQGLVTQPSIDDDSQFNDEGLSTMENLGNMIDSVTNPGGRLSCLFLQAVKYIFRRCFSLHYYVFPNKYIIYIELKKLSVVQASGSTFNLDLSFRIIKPF
jgi:hypothetical protein